MDEEKEPKKVTDLDALQENAESAVMGFTERWMSMPSFSDRCEVMDVRQLRDAMGLRATQESGDPWPAAEWLLLRKGFRWHYIGGQRVMFLQEKEGFAPDTGWEEATEIEN